MQAHNLPHHITSFVGRENELDGLVARLAEPACRLLTLVGPGGIGKTRLAIETAARMLDDFSDGVIFIDLQPVTSPDLLATAIAEAIGFSFHGQQDPEAQLLQYLAERQKLLLLDNFEHLLEGAELLAEILTAAPQVKLLVTSREALNLQEEWVWHVDGMRYPESDVVNELDAFSALRLFIERARRVRRDFSPAAEQACIIRICQLVGGMPLGIELAAAWLKRLPCQKIVREIERNLDFLATNVRNIPERHRSMRAVFEHSWQLLDEEERAALKRLSVFRGGFRQAAAEQVAGAPLLTLSSLVDKSLLRVTPTGRYEFHELLRQFAEEKLEQNAEEMEEIQDLHCTYYAEFLYRRRDDSKGPKQVQFMEEVEAEIQNVRTAWNHAVAQADLESIDKSMESLWRFYQENGWYLQGDQAFGSAVTQVRSGETLGERGIILGRLLARQGYIAHALGQHEKMRACTHESLTLLEYLGARRETIIPLIVQLWVHQLEGAMEEARQLGLQLLEIATGFGDHWAMGLAQINLAEIANAVSDYQEVEFRLNECLRLFRQIGDCWGAAWGLQLMSKVTCLRGRFQEASQLARESMIMAIETKSRQATKVTFGALGDAAFALGEYEAAKQNYREGLAFCKEIAERPIRAGYLICLAAIAQAQGEQEVAQRLFSQSLTIAQEINDRGLIARSLQGLGRVAFRVGEIATAKRHFEDSLALPKGGAGRLGMVGTLIISTLNDLGQVAHALENDLEAKAHFYEALQRGLGIGAFPLVLESLVGIAELIAAEGRLEQTVELLSLGLHHPACHATTKPRAERLLTMQEDRLSPDDFAAAKHRGATMDLEATAEAQLRELSEWLAAHQGPVHPPSGDQPLAEPLSEREIEVLQLMAEGMSNRMIGEQLFITTGTVKVHASNIYGKLGVNNRTQAVARGRELSLL